MTHLLHLCVEHLDRQPQSLERFTNPTNGRDTIAEYETRARGALPRRDEVGVDMRVLVTLCALYLAECETLRKACGRTRERF